MRTTLVAVIVTLLSISQTTWAVDCTAGGKDFSKLASATDYTASETSGGTTYTFTFNICKEISAGCGGATGVASCQSWGTGAQSCGVLSKMEITEGDGGVIFTYPGGDGGRTTHVVLGCGESETPGNFTASTASDGITYTITGTSSLTCVGGGKKKGLSGGWIFFIILISSFSVYLIGGTVYKAQRQGQSGIEAVPNIDFWRNLPGLIKDGFRFTFGLCGRGGGAQGGYSDMP
eukprot:TRINITY_DN20129_c0_g1_i1.p1 TRINITY_DN20129_c0_g1~~TRINITY_DN20129_c0_g1_i1.p1  ORF type:complete len:233 (-),score=55.41 TRINITY_DN20129_c0_g1_i1:221-919(-)